MKKYTHIFTFRSCGQYYNTYANSNIKTLTRSEYLMARKESKNILKDDEVVFLNHTVLLNK